MKHLITPTLLLTAAAVDRSPAPIPDNGAVAHAHPVQGITIDGDLRDWGRSKRYPIKHAQICCGVESSCDFSASFRVAYGDGALFLAVEVKDDDYVSDPDLPWHEQDSMTIYVDPTHSPRGSGAMLFTGFGEERRLIGLENSWDPAVATTSWEHADLAVVRNENVTVYEWRIELGDAARPGRSLGLDLLIRERDDDDGPAEGDLMSWGPMGPKSRGASRCGDVILVAPGATGRLRGTIGWADDREANYPRRVRITSVDDPEYWFHVEANHDGEFAVDVPAGDYRITSPFKIYEQDDELYSMDQSVAVLATVVADETTRAEALGLADVDAPQLFESRGLLHDWNVEASAKVDRFLDAYLQHLHIPGASVAVIKDGKLAYHRALGLKNFYTEEPVTNDTVFEAASITKAVFAVAVNRIVERGEFDLDRPMHEYVAFEAIEDDPRYEQITGRHCITHRSGLPNWGEGEDMEIAFEPGTRYGYSGEAIQWLGRALEKVRGKSIDEILREEVTEPMGFAKNTWFADSPELRAARSSGHYTTRTTWHDVPSEVGVAHSMHTEAATFANFMTALMRQDGMQAETFNAMLRPQSSMPEADAEPFWPQSFGRGFHLRESPFGPVYGHGGNNGDFKCGFEIYRDHDMGFVVFTNSSEGHLLVKALRKLLVIGKPIS